VRALLDCSTCMRTFNLKTKDTCAYWQEHTLPGLCMSLKQSKAPVTNNLVYDQSIRRRRQTTALTQR
jgi:hypothetical protein